MVDSLHFSLHHWNMPTHKLLFTSEFRECLAVASVITVSYDQKFDLRIGEGKCIWEKCCNKKSSVLRFELWLAWAKRGRVSKLISAVLHRLTLAEKREAHTPETLFLSLSVELKPGLVLITGERRLLCLFYCLLWAVLTVYCYLHSCALIKP